MVYRGAVDEESRPLTTEDRSSHQINSSPCKEASGEPIAKRTLEMEWLTNRCTTLLAPLGSSVLVLRISSNNLIT